MLSLSRKALLIALGSGTLAGGLGAVGARVGIQYAVSLPEGAVAPSFDGAPVEAGGESTASVSSPERSSRRSKKNWLDPILKRNVFDSTKVGQFSTSNNDDGDAGSRTSLPLVLLATVVTEPPEFSSALIQEDGGSEGAAGYGIGDSVLDEATIHRIEQRRVILKRSTGELEYLEMDDASVKAPKKERKGKKKKWDGIEKSGDNKFTVDEDTFNKALENPEKLANSIRAVPHTDSDGKIDGYRLSGIRRSSLFNKLGIRNGDVVHSVNGNSLDSMQNAMSAYNSLQGERDFNFEVTRRGKRNTFEYEVR